MSNQHSKISKFLSYVLRHAPDSIHLNINTEGWVDIDELLQKIAMHSELQVDRALLMEVVEQNDKKRFTVEGNNIRAAQGHSTEQVTIRYLDRRPPDVLYHGTATRFLPAINAEGLCKQSRQHVHLSEDKLVAIAVGKRYGKVAVLEIDAFKLHADGCLFYQADNGVWLTDHVPSAYFKELDNE